MATTNSINKYVQNVKSYLTDITNKIIFDVKQHMDGTKTFTADEITHLRGTIIRYRRDYDKRTSIMIYGEIREIWENFTQTQTYTQSIPPILRNRRKPRYNTKRDAKVQKVPKSVKESRKKKITNDDVTRANELVKIYNNLKQKREETTTTIANGQATQNASTSSLIYYKSCYNITEYYQLLKKQNEENEKSK